MADGSPFLHDLTKSYIRYYPDRFRQVLLSEGKKWFWLRGGISRIHEEMELRDGAGRPCFIDAAYEVCHRSKAALIGFEVKSGGVLTEYMLDQFSKEKRALNRVSDLLDRQSRRVTFDNISLCVFARKNVAAAASERFRGKGGMLFCPIEPLWKDAASIQTEVMTAVAAR